MGIRILFILLHIRNNHNLLLIYLFRVMRMNGRYQWKLLFISLLLPLAVGALASAITGDSVLDYALMRKPPLSPPGWIFPLVWTLLYCLMGLASWLMWTSDASYPRKKRALRSYILQLAVNFFWPLIFFKARLYLAAFLWLLLLWLLAAACTLRFFCIKKTAGYTMLPYMLWLSFATYLNLGVYLLN